MKNILKSRVFIVFITVILTGTVGVFAEDILEAVGINYKNKTVEDSLNELYIKANAKDVGALKFCKVVEGTYGSFGEIGSKYECDPGDGVIRNFYLLTVNNDNTVDLIMDRNINEGAITWDNAVQYFKTGDGVTVRNNWVNILNIQLPDVQALADIFPNNSWYYANDNMTWWCLGTHGKDLSNVPYCNSSTNQKYTWLFNHLTNCESGGCLDNSNATSRGYWTYNYSNGNHAYYVWYTGLVSRNTTTNGDYYGIRPVITVLKTNLYTE